MRVVLVRGLALLAALAACAVPDEGPAATLQLAVKRPRALTVTRLELTVLAGASCGSQGELSGGSPLPGLSGIEILLGTPKVLKVSPGDRTFAVVGFDGAVANSRGCSRTTLVPGGAAEVEITLVEMPPLPDGGVPDAPVEPADAGPDAMPPANDTCATAAPLPVGAFTPGDTRGAADDVALACVANDSGDTFHVIDTSAAGARSKLVTRIPEAPGWAAAMSLLPQAGCETGAGALSCVPGAFDVLYINQPNLPGGVYDLVVDGREGARGGYQVRYDLAPPDTGFGYRRVDSTAPYLELSDGVVVPGFSVGPSSDEAAWNIPLPFAFPFHGQMHTGVAAHANLFLTFGTVPSGGAAYLNECPQGTNAPNDVIALFWDDGMPAWPTSTLRTKVEGTAPFRRFIIEYKDWDLMFFGMGSFQPQGMKLTQQVVLYEDGDIELRFGPRDNTGAQDRDCGLDRIFGCSATIGLQGPGGNDVDTVACDADGTMMTDGTVIRFVHPR